MDRNATFNFKKFVNLHFICNRYDKKKNGENALAYKSALRNVWFVVIAVYNEVRVTPKRQ